MTPIEITAIIGAITGSVSLSIVTYKTWKEKPRLNFTIEKAYWSIHTVNDPTFNPISINVRIDNKGNKGTTIHSTSISFDYDGEHKTIKDNHNISILIPPHESTRQLFSYHIKRNEFKIENDIKNATLTMNYTHGQKEIQIPIIGEWK